MVLFLIASVLDWWCINKIFENKRECVFPAIKRAIKRVKTPRKYLEKNGFKIPTFAIYFFDGSPYPFCCFDQEETILKARKP